MEAVVELSYKEKMCLRLCKKNQHNEYEVIVKISSKRKIAEILSELRHHDIQKINANPKHNQISIITDEIKIILNDYSKLKKDKTLNGVSSIKSVIEFTNKELLRARIRTLGRLVLTPKKIIVTSTLTAAILMSLSIGNNSLVKNNQKTELISSTNTISIENQIDYKESVNIEKKYETNNLEPDAIENTDKIVQVNNKPKTTSTPCIETVIYKNEYIDKIAKIFNMDYYIAETITNNMEIPDSTKATKDNAWTVTTLDLLDTINNGTTLNYNRTKLTQMIAIQRKYINDKTIDKKPIISDKNEEEKEIYIIDIAKNIYGVIDEELLQTMIMARRLETGRGTSDRCINDNNQGGIKNGKGAFATYETFEIGAESFVRNFLLIYARSIVMETQKNNNSPAEIMGNQYCTEETEHWISTVNELIQTETMPVSLKNDETFTR